MSHRWREIHFLIPRERSEPWADACLAAGALSAEAEDADAESPDEQPQYGEPGMPLPPSFGWQRTRLKVLLDEATAPDTLLAEAAQVLGEGVPPIDRTVWIEDQDWVRMTQAQYTPIPVGNRLLIAPSWHADDPVAAGCTVIIVDPGLAFGTGSHPTTRMCLEWLDAHDLAGVDLLDYGCGSGILAIAAARLGAAPVTATDIDPQAMRATADNARINGVELVLPAVHGPTPQPATVVMANILSSPLKLLAPMLGALVRPGGVLVLSGILQRQWQEVAACYPQFALQVWQEREGWVCLAGPLRGEHPSRVLPHR